MKPIALILTSIALLAATRLRPLVALLLLLAFTSGAKARTPKPAWRALDGIELNDVLRERIGAIAQIYFAKTRRTLEITSGYRSPARQAAAMYTKIVTGGSLAIYKNQALVDPLRKAYREGRKKKLGKAKIIEAMAAVLQSQVDRGIFLSRHMKGRAFDVRSNGLTTRQRSALREAIAEVGGMRVIYESRPPHFHIEILERDAPDDGGGLVEGVDNEDDVKEPAHAPEDKGNR